MTALRLYDYAASANCYKVRLLLAQLAVPYERVVVDIFDGDTLDPEFARMNPARTTPVLEVAPGVHLAESNAILVYLAEGTDLYAEDRLERAQIIRWLLFEQADVVATIGSLRFRLLTGRLRPDHPSVVKRREGALAALATLDAHLTGRSFLVADRYTIADIGMYAYTHVAGDAGLDTSACRAFEAWRTRVAGQPGHINDLEPYPANSQMSVSRSIYD
jgi:glutathione S-transferase